MEQLINIIVNLKSQRPKYYIDVFDLTTNSWLKRKYSYEQILSEAEDVVAWFNNLGSELQVQQWTKNGTSWHRKGQPVIVTNQQQSTIVATQPTIQHLQESTGLNAGLNAVQLQVNNALFEDLKLKYAELKQDYKDVKRKNKKLKTELSDLDKELYELNFEKEKKPLVTEETIKKYAPMLNGLMAKFVPQPQQGLAAPQEEQLPEEVATFFNFVKTHESPVVLVGVLGSLYQNYLEQLEKQKQPTQ